MSVLSICTMSTSDLDVWGISGEICSDIVRSFDKVGHGRQTVRLLKLELSEITTAEC